MRIEREVFTGILTAVQPGLASREVLEQTQSFIFMDGYVMTYNDEVSVRHPIPIKVAGAVKADELYKLLRRTKLAVIDVEVNQGEGESGQGEFIVRTKTSQAGIALQSKITAPVKDLKVPDVESDEWKDLPKNFMEALIFCSATVSSNMSRPIFTCIHINKGTAESSDSFRVTTFKLSEPVTDSFLVPGAIIRFLKQYTLEAYCATEGWLHFLTDKKAVFSCRTFSQDYPNIAPLLNVEGESFDLPDGLEDVVQRAVVFVEGEEFAKDKRIDIKVKEGMMLLESHGVNGWFKEKVSIRYKGEAFEFAITPDFLLQAYKMSKECIIGEGRLKMSGDQFAHVLALVEEGEEGEE